MKKVFPALTLGIACFASSIVQAQPTRGSPLTVSQSAVVATAPGQASVAVYLSIENLDKRTDYLVAITSPIAAEAVLHFMDMDGNVMKMREVERLSVAPSSKMSLQPDSGYHIMLTGLKQSLKAGNDIPLTLTFEHAGQMEIMARVVANKAALATPSASKSRSGRSGQ